MAAARRKPRLAVWKFASCDGCQLSLLDCEDELLAVADAVDIAYFPEATRAAVRRAATTCRWSKARSPRRTTPSASRTSAAARASWSPSAPAPRPAASRRCATSPTCSEYTSIVYARPDYIHTLATSTPIAEHVPVDFELRGCPISKRQLVEVITAFLAGRRPVTPAHSVCVECKLKGNVCVMVAHGTPCLGPVTHAGCGALCPSYDRGCYGCYGPMETPNAPVAQRQAGASSGMDGATIAARLPHLQRQRPGVPRGERAPWPVRPSRSTIWPAWRARAPSRSWCATAWWSAPS